MENRNKTDIDQALDELIEKIDNREKNKTIVYVSREYADDYETAYGNWFYYNSLKRWGRIKLKTKFIIADIINKLVPFKIIYKY